MSKRNRAKIAPRLKVGLYILNIENVDLFTNNIQTYIDRIIEINPDDTDPNNPEIVTKTIWVKSADYEVDAEVGRVIKFYMDGLWHTYEYYLMDEEEAFLEMI